MFKVLVLSVLVVYIKASPIPLAVKSNRNVEVYEVKSDDGDNSPTVVDIGPVDQPVVLNWVSQSSTLKTNQRHISAPGSLQKDSVTDEPQRLLQEILRPVVQEIREIVVPSRTIVQEIRPVQENVRTIVARGQDRGTAGGLGGGLAGGLGDGLGLGGGNGGYGGGNGGYGGGNGGYGGGNGGYGSLSLGGDGYGKSLIALDSYGSLSSGLKY